MEKILIVHTNYQNIGGEDIAVKNEISFLEKYFQVETLLYSNVVKNYFLQAVFFLFNKNINSMNILEQKISEFKPDIVYVHNTWFKASLGIFKILSKKKIKTIIKLHNFRYFCTKSFLSKKHLENKSICGACGMKNEKVGSFNKYFSNSFIKSFFMIRYGKKYFEILKNHNFDIVVLTNFHKEFLENLDFKKNKLHVIPNYIEIDESSIQVDRKNIIYAGRISKEKGIDKLIDAFLKSKLQDWSLKIYGNGPEYTSLSEKCKKIKNIEFFGEKDNEEIIENIKESSAVVTATTLYEGQPTLLCEASILGIPSIFPKTGGIEEFFPPGYKLSFDPSNFDDFVNKVNLLGNLDSMKKQGIENQNYIKNYLNKDKILEGFKNIFYE